MVSVIFPSGTISRDLETSAAAQPDHVRRPIGEAADFEAMAASNPAMVQQLASPEDAARGVLDDLLADEWYVVTHGDLVEAVVSRCRALRRAAEIARDREGGGLALAAGARATDEAATMRHVRASYFAGRSLRPPGTRN
jgi:hypothetical protein